MGQDFIPVIDINARKVVHIDWPACRVGSTNKVSAPSGTGPPALTDDSFKLSGRERIPPPLNNVNYLPDLMAADSNYAKPTIEPLKPLHIVQPEGVSFRMVEHNVLEWQAWKMHIG